MNIKVLRYPLSSSSSLKKVESLTSCKERKKPGLRAGYGRELEQRLDRLEDVLRNHAQILESSFGVNSMSNGTENSQIPDFRQTSGFSSHRQTMMPGAETALFLQKPAFGQHHSQAANYSINIPQTTPMTAGHGDVFTQSQQSPSLKGMPTLIQHSLPPTESSQEPSFKAELPRIRSAVPDGGQTQTDFSSDQTLPPYDLLYALVDLYFKHVNTWCPILHRRTTLDALFGPSPLDDADKILLHAIVATTLRFSVDERLTEESCRHYHDYSKQKVLLYGLENSSVKALQALVILALDLVGSSNGPPGWNLLALLTRAVVQLGLAVETTSHSVSPNYPSIYTLRAMVLPEANSWIEDESRRRLFWMVRRIFLSTLDSRSCPDFW